MDKLIVTQADRDLAREIVSRTRGYGVNLPHDDHFAIQLAAGHRIASQAELVDALEQIVAGMADDEAAHTLNWGHAKDALIIAREALSHTKGESK